MTGTTINRNSFDNIGASFSYTPPTRFVRVAKAIEYPSFMIPINLQVNEIDMDAISEQVADFFAGRYIGLDLDFYPVLPHDPVEDLDLVRDFMGRPQVNNFYNQVCNTKSPKSLDVSFVADDVPASKRFRKYSRFILDKSKLLQKAKRMYKVKSITCTSLFNATQEQIEAAGFTYSPNNIAKGKLNSRFVDSIKSINPGFTPLPSSLVIFLKVEQVTKAEELKEVHDLIDSDVLQIPQLFCGYDVGSALDIILEPESV